MDVAKRFTVGFTLPALSYQLVREGNRPWGLQGDESIVFYMRPAWSDELVITAGAATIVDAASDTIKYEWISADVDTEGDYRGWFRVTGTTGVEETEEFDIVGLAHSPGVGVRLGPIARAARREIPVDWDYLSKLPGFGDAELDEKVETAKLFVLQTIVPVTDEGGLDKRVVDYIGKMAAIEIIPAAISFWMNQIQAQTARGSGEIQSFPNRIAALQDKSKYLIAYTKRLELTIAGLTGMAISHTSAQAPAVDTMGPFVTPGLENFHRPFGGQAADPRKRSPTPGSGATSDQWDPWGNYGGVF